VMLSVVRIIIIMTELAAVVVATHAEEASKLYKFLPEVGSHYVKVVGIIITSHQAFCVFAWIL